MDQRPMTSQQAANYYQTVWTSNSNCPHPPQIATTQAQVHQQPPQFQVLTTQAPVHGYNLRNRNPPVNYQEPGSLRFSILNPNLNQLNANDIECVRSVPYKNNGVFFDNPPTASRPHENSRIDGVTVMYPNLNLLDQSHSFGHSSHQGGEQYQIPENSPHTAVQALNVTQAESIPIGAGQTVNRFQQGGDYGVAGLVNGQAIIPATQPIQVGGYQNIGPPPGFHQPMQTQQQPPQIHQPLPVPQPSPIYLPMQSLQQQAPVHQQIPVRQQTPNHQQIPVYQPPPMMNQQSAGGAPTSTHPQNGEVENNFVQYPALNPPPVNAVHIPTNSVVQPAPYQISGLAQCGQPPPATNMQFYQPIPPPLVNPHISQQIYQPNPQPPQFNPTVSQPPPQFPHPIPQSSHTVSQSQYAPQVTQQSSLAETMQLFCRMQINNNFTQVSIQLPFLNGTEGREKIGEFFQNLELFAGDWLEQDKIRLLKSKLRDKASKALGAAIAKCGENSYYVLKAEMCENLRGTDTNEASAFAELTGQAQRRSGEGVVQFANRIQKLVTRAFPHLSMNQLDETSKMYFVNHLGDLNIARLLEMQKSQSFDELLMLANRLDTLGSVKSNPQTGNSNQRFANQDRYNPQNFQQNSQQNSQLQQNPPNSQVQSNPNPNIPPLFQNRLNLPAGNFSQPNQIPSTGTPGANPTPFPSRILQNNAISVRFSEEFLVDNEEIADNHTDESPPFIKFFESITNECDFDDIPQIPVTGFAPCIEIPVDVMGSSGRALIDTGAEISVVNPEFVHNLAMHSGVGLMEMQFRPNSGPHTIPYQVSLLMGSRVSILGSVKIPIRYNDQITDIHCLITDAPFSYDVILGTVAIHEMGFYFANKYSGEILQFKEPSYSHSSHIAEVNTVHMSHLKANSAIIDEFPKAKAVQASISPPQICHSQSFMKKTNKTKRSKKRKGKSPQFISRPIPLNQIKFSNPPCTIPVQPNGIGSIAEGERFSPQISASPSPSNHPNSSQSLESFSQYSPSFEGKFLAITQSTEQKAMDSLFRGAHSSPHFHPRPISNGHSTTEDSTSKALRQ